MTAPRSANATRFLTHAGGAALAGLGVFFTLWLWALNPVLPRIFGQLAGPWVWGNAPFEWDALAYGLATAGVCGVLGWFLLECFEIYEPALATASLALIFGFGLAGMVLESLAMPYWLSRRTIALGLLALLAFLAAGAWRRARRPTESGLGGEAGPAEHRMRRRMARQAHARAVQPMRGLAERLFFGAALALTAAIWLADLWHALLYPDVYWDSLILYLGYARQTFLLHGFPVKICGQVGIGLGSNYPHLYAVLGAGAATALGHWSELPQRLWAPLCGLASTILVYHAALRLTRRRGAAMAVALLYRAIPLANIYDQYASDYTMVMLFAAAFLYLALRAIETGLVGYLILSALLIGFSMHLNYLMGILWGPWAVAAWEAQVGWPKGAAGEADPLGADPGAPWTARPRRLGWRGLLGGGWFWLTLLVAGAIGSTWLVRNWIVTGNPVYAFFYKFFTATKNVNPEVMDASAVEWLANGAGIGRLGRTIPERLWALPPYFFSAPFWIQGYQTSPIAGAFALGGGLVWLGRFLASPWMARRSGIGRVTRLGARASRPQVFENRRAGEMPAFPGIDGHPFQGRVAARFGLVVALLFAALVAFHVVLAPFYLYQIIMIAPCMALLAALGWPLWSARPWRWAFGALALAAGIVPGLAMALMGFKIAGMIQLPGTSGVHPATLYVLHHPMPDARTFYRWRYGDDAVMWDYINKNLKGEKLLTHENRDLALDPSIQIVNLDDWDMQSLWKIDDPVARVRCIVHDYGIKHYLYIPNEDATPTNARMGTKDWPRLGLAKLVYETQSPPNKLYVLTPPPEKPASSLSTTAR
jgi:hypothetical protein